MSRRDVLATVLVGIGVLLYLAWLGGVEIAWFADVSSVAVAVLVLGVAASLSAVLPLWDELMDGSRIYFGGTSAIGVVALVAGLWAILAQEPVALGLLVVTTVLLWALSTIRHIQVHRLEPHAPSP